ncbi:MAG: hypothetical protein ACJ72Q_07720 [Nitrososphaeraceae archaeon]
MGRVGFEPTTGLPLSSKISSIDNSVFTGPVLDRSLIKLPQKESSIKCIMSGRDFWSGFQSYLSKNNNHLGTRDRLNYAIKYAHMLDTYDARELLQLSHEKRIHIMKSLTAMI